MRVFVVLVVLMAAAVHAAPAPDTPFPQERVTRMTYQGTPKIADWEELPFAGVRQVEVDAASGDTFVLTAGAVWVQSGGSGEFTLRQNVDTHCRMALLGVRGSFAVACPDSVTVCGSTATPRSPDVVAAELLRVLEPLGASPTPTPVPSPSPAPGPACSAMQASFGEVFDTALSRDKATLFVAAAKGLMQVPLHPSAKAVDIVRFETGTCTPADGMIRTVAVDPTTDRVACATHTRLCIKLERGWHFFYVSQGEKGGVIGSNVTALAYDADGTLWVGSKEVVNAMNTDLSIRRFDARNGLPYGNITSVGVDSGNNVWLGTTHGAMMWDGSMFHYRNGPRFVWGYNVTSVAGWHTDLGGAVVATEAGVTRLVLEEWTLARKAAHYEECMPRHDRHGLVSGADFDHYGDPRTYTGGIDANSGLWTSIYLFGEAYKYAITRNATDKARAWHFFEGMEMLVNVTGVPGYPARTFVITPGEKQPTGKDWHQSSVHPNYWWNGDTSSDEITGHLGVYPILYDLVAETAEEKARVLNVLNTMISTIVKNGYTLHGLNGKPTTWGKWSPQWVNDDPDWSDQRGLNALQIISYLISAYQVTGTQSYLDDAFSLMHEHSYDINIINQKIELPLDDNFSDNELAFVPYHTFFFCANKTDLLQHESGRALYNAVSLGIKRAWEHVRHDNASLWNLVYGVAVGATPQEMRLDATLSTLRQWPLDRIDWQFENVQRLDWRWSPYPNRDDRPEGATLFPYDEINYFRWNGDPYDTESGGGGRSQTDPGAWIFPYWFAVYHGLLAR